MDKKDSALIDRFVQRVVREVPSVEAILLFGSMARGDYDSRSDIDIMLVLDVEDPAGHGPAVAGIITRLRPHREIRPVLTNLHDYDEDYYQNVFREGKVLFGKVILTPETMALRPYLLISYDLSDRPNALQVKVSKRVHGYTTRKVVGGREKIYRYPGVKDTEGGMMVSKSAVILPFAKGSDLQREFEGLGVSCRVFKIWM